MYFICKSHIAVSLKGSLWRCPLGQWSNIRFIIGILKLSPWHMRLRILFIKGHSTFEFQFWHSNWILYNFDHCSKMEFRYLCHTCYHQPTKAECLESKFLVLWFFPCFLPVLAWKIMGITIVLKYSGHAMWFGPVLGQHLWTPSRLAWKHKNVNATYLLFLLEGIKIA